MKYLLCSIRIGLFKILAFFIAASAISHTAFAFDYPDPGNFSLGAQQWANNCGRCHNLRGPEDLRDDQWITAMYHMRVRAGLTGEETRNILTFLQVSNNTRRNTTSVQSNLAEVGSVDTLSGREVYDQTCVACHGSNGKGAISGVPDLSDRSGRLSQSDDVLLLNVNTGLQSPGSPMAMPARGGNPNLTESNIRSVIEYMRSTFGKSQNESR